MGSAVRNQTGSNFRRLASNLQRDDGAMAVLASQGVDAGMVRALGLGMKEPYTRADGTRVENVLAFPITSSDGRRRYAYLNIPDYTLNPEHPVGWGPGKPQVMSTGQGTHTLIVCASALETWQVERATMRSGRELAAIASSQPGRAPSEWLRAGYWSGWGRIVVLDSVDEALRVAIGRAAMRPLDLATGSLIDEGADDGAMARRLGALIKGATPIRVPPNDLLATLSNSVGDYDVKPITVHGGIANGHLYYAFTVERREHGTGGRADGILHRYQALVIRSDGELLEASTLPAPRGTPAHRRVHALTDGTRISALPDPGHHASWSLAGIRQFASARLAGEDPCVDHPAQLAVEAVRHLRECIRLPDERDYWVLTAFVIAGYLHRVFDALPLIHIHGEKGSGKSELTSKIVELGFNGEMMAQGSASALIRLVRESGGLVAIDDAEGLVCGSSEISQALKSGYKQATAVKVVVMPGGRTEAIDFFGPRIVCNTVGLDPVLASRAIRVATATNADVDMSAGVDLDLAGWRDAMHAFAMARLHQVQVAYERIRLDVSDRRSEIWSPLRAIAEVVGNPDMMAAVSTD